MSEPTAIDEHARPPKDAPPPENGEGEDVAADDASAQFSDDQTLAEVFVRSVSEAIATADKEKAQELCSELHPADLADLFGLLDEEERAGLTTLLGDALKPEVLAELDPDLTEEIVTAMQPEQVAEAVTELDTDDAAFILEELDEEKRAEILAEVPVTDRLALHAAFDYEEDSAGRMMQRDVFAAPAYWTVGQIIDRLRGSDDMPNRFFEVFVIDPSFKPIGEVPLSSLY